MVAAALLGGCRISVGERMVDTASSRRTRGLVAYLVVHRRAWIPRDVLMDIFWPHAAPAAARNSLHVALTRVRAALRAAGGEALLERNFDTYGISRDADVRLDVDQVEAAGALARRAIAAGDAVRAEQAYGMICQLYAGVFLADDLYVDWALPVRERLAREAIEAQRGLMHIYLRRGDCGAAAVLARAVLVVDPADEDVNRGLMACLASSGQRHLALEQYRRMARTLWRTYRIGPSAESAALYEAIRKPGPYRSAS
ncbi:AfsR/SARP family transcriptional regulator [Pseudonocardia hierapolitana]|uniref:AfsR/SARP family transcriptional regulator n=1 Tax=Pseudonocardia hierapolitana TaxID=1128676 RepID=UPI0011BF8987|nr:BTAD domain-containing putative transcriptional regulator [Pseudonocardia hierapolitana]